MANPGVWAARVIRLGKQSSPPGGYASTARLSGARVRADRRRTSQLGILTRRRAMLSAHRSLPLRRQFGRKATICTSLQSSAS